MKRVMHPDQVRSELAGAAPASRRVGLVPTMGALHEGHLSLVRRCRAECEVSVVSLFVNPVQFGPREDFEAYPRDPERDAAALEREGVDLLFTPSVSEIYAPDHKTWVEVAEMSGALCGASRPGHFRAVATIVAKLLNIVRPDTAYFGQKDWQQAIILTRMARDLDFSTRIIIEPTVREPDGLAMSSRNIYLTPAERPWAPRLYQALVAGATEARLGGRTTADVKRVVEKGLHGTPLQLQYVEIRRARDLEPTEALHGELLIAAAAYLGSTRLIDNVVIQLPG